VAIIGVIVGFFQLFKDSKEKQSQINVLTDLAKESALQTNHLASQVDEMIEGNKLLAKHVNLIQENVSINEKTFILEQDRNDLDKQQRKNEIKPVFDIIQYNSVDNQIILNLQVSKGTAKYVKVEVENENIQVSAECNYSDKLILPYYVMELKISSNSTIYVDINSISLNVKLFYMDVENTMYYQEIKGVQQSGLKIGVPIEVV
jgi:hypothetical protein